MVVLDRFFDHLAKEEDEEEVNDAMVDTVSLLFPA